MEASPNLLTRVSARITLEAMATVLSPHFVVTTTDAIPPDAWTVVILRSSAWSPQEVSATVESRDADLGFYVAPAGHRSHGRAGGPPRSSRTALWLHVESLNSSGITAVMTVGG